MRILVLEDERDIAQGVVEALERDRYETVWVNNTSKARSKFAELEFDLAVLDVMIGNDDNAGFDLAADLRAAGFLGPIIFTTARDRVEDRIHGLDLGGDDYLVKPFSLAELTARVRALLRRDSTVKQSVLESGPLRIDYAARRVWWKRKECNLSDREFGILEMLSLHPQRVFSTAEIQDRFFPDAAPTSGVVRVYMRQIRTKVHEAVIATVSGGYRLGIE